MHIQEIDRGDGTELIQGFVRARWPARAELGLEGAHAWIRLFLRSASLWSQANPLSAAVRIMIEPGNPVTTVHSFVVPKSDEGRLRLLLAAFMRTDRVAAGETEGPQAGMDLSGRFVHPGEARVRLACEALTAGTGVAIHQNLRLADWLPRIMQTFADLNVPFAYEFQATPWTPSRQLLRECLHGVARLSAEPGAPQRLVADQAALGERLKGASFHVEECVSVPSAWMETASETLYGLLGDSFYSAFGALPRVEAVDPERAQAFAYHVHSALVTGVSPEGEAAIAGAAAREEVNRYISCVSLGLPASGIALDSSQAEPLALSLAPARPAAAHVSPAGAPFLFVSYARTDVDRVVPIVDRLAHDGAALWLDRRLVAGDDWITELEAQLMTCSGVVAFISPSFAASKYCRREVRFADALNKKIIPVFLTDATLADGLNFILHDVQRVTVDSSGDSGTIIAAIRKHVPSTYSGPVRCSAD